MSDVLTSAVGRGRRAFPYYGSKTRLAPLYSEPSHDLIIEPFAGAAAYSQRYWEKDVYLFDVCESVIACWQYLITASSADINTLPDLKPGDNINTFEQLSKGERALLQMHAYDGFATKGRLIGSRCIWNKRKPELAGLVHRFNHWHAEIGSYHTLNNPIGTWFVDPPYVNGGSHYEHNDINYSHLATWCKSRNGHLIVCENTSADWLDFKPLCALHGLKHKTTECVFECVR